MFKTLNQKTAPKNKAHASQRKKSALVDNRPHVVSQRKVMQRALNEVDRNDLIAFYDWHIMEIGSPTSAKNRAVLHEAMEMDNLADAKQYILAHIAAFKEHIDQESDEFGGEESLEDQSGTLPKHYTFEQLKKLGLKDRIHKIGELQQDLDLDKSTTAFERDKTAHGHERDDMVRLYRYHKFPADPVSGQMVTGGFFNKSMLSHDGTGDTFHRGTVRKILNERAKSFNVLTEDETGEDSETVKTKKAKKMEKFQASAKETPFIATTLEPRYARSLFDEYPPSSKQIATMLTITGPRRNTFDFESEFERLAAGPQARNYRTTDRRAHDADQAEYGIPEIAIPLGKVSPMGFSIEHIETLGTGDTPMSKDGGLVVSSMKKLHTIDISKLHLDHSHIQTFISLLQQNALPNLRTLIISEGQLPRPVIDFLSLHFYVVIR